MRSRNTTPGDSGGVGERSRPAPARGRRAFTIIEITVSLAALVILSLGLVAILSAVGKTVTGGRKASRLTTAAQLIESAIRRDIEQISPQGFLVIRQQYVDGLPNGQFDDPALLGAASDRVPLSEEDTSGRARRVDELLFFRNGVFESKRTPLNPDAAPVASRTARVYIGHGQRRAEDLTANSPYSNPFPSDRMVDAGMRLGEQTPNNPNRYASSWILLRNALVLSKPRDVESNIYTPTNVFDIDPTTAAGRRRIADSRFQIGMQPAAPSIFRGVNFTYPRPAVADVIRDGFTGDPDPRGVSLASGLVDIAATDLMEIRAMVYGYAQKTGPGRLMPAGLVQDQIPILQPDEFYSTPWDPANGVYRTRPASPEPLDIIHTWMSNALPAESDQTLQNGAYLGHGELPGARMRAEASAINLLGIIENDAATPVDQRNQSSAIVDQRMLQSSNLLVGCTEIIIDWSFGEYDALGRQKWYGPSRRAGDTNGDGAINDQDLVVTRPYGTVDPLDPGATLLTQPVPLLDPDGDIDDDGDIDQTDADLRLVPYQHPVTPRLIYGIDPLDDGSHLVLTSHFGDLDPTYSYDTLLQRLRDAGEPDNVPGEEVVPWVWPKMLRFTISLTDPDVPNYESTFQFVVTLPPRGDQSAN